MLNMSMNWAIGLKNCQRLCLMVKKNELQNNGERFRIKVIKINKSNIHLIKPLERDLAGRVMRAEY